MKIKLILIKLLLVIIILGGLIGTVYLVCEHLRYKSVMADIAGLLIMYGSAYVAAFAIAFVVPPPRIKELDI